MSLPLTAVCLSSTLPMLIILIRVHKDDSSTAIDATLLYFSRSPLMTALSDFLQEEVHHHSGLPGHLLGVLSASPLRYQGLFWS